MEFDTAQETWIRLGVFAGVFACMAALEMLTPRRPRAEPVPRRWFTNVAIVALDTLALRLLFPILAVGVAKIAEENGWGLFSLVALPFWFEVAVCAIALDLAIYGQHVASHKVPILWRVHRVHHADRDIDVTTGARFHPVEIVLSMLYKFVVIIALGAPMLAVFIFEVLLNGSSMFNHANWRMPLWLDRIARRMIVTPDMHRVHHSVRENETDSNYGFNLSVWDRMFGTYIEQPRDGHEGMTIGLKPYQDSKPSSLLWCLLLPFKGK